MSERHHNTTWRAIDPAVLEGLRAARHDVDELAGRLAQITPDPDGNPAHCEEVWKRGPPRLAFPCK